MRSWKRATSSSCDERRPALVAEPRSSPNTPCRMRPMLPLRLSVDPAAPPLRSSRLKEPARTSPLLLTALSPARFASSAMAGPGKVRLGQSDANMALQLLNFSVKVISGNLNVVPGPTPGRL